MLKLTLNHIPEARLTITLEDGKKIHIYSIPKSGYVASLLIDAPREIKIKREYNLSPNDKKFDCDRVIWKEKDNKHGKN